MSQLEQLTSNPNIAGIMLTGLSLGMGLCWTTSLKHRIKSHFQPWWNIAAAAALIKATTYIPSILRDPVWSTTLEGDDSEILIGLAIVFTICGLAAAIAGFVIYIPLKAIYLLSRVCKDCGSRKWGRFGDSAKWLGTSYNGGNRVNYEWGCENCGSRWYITDYER